MAKPHKVFCVGLGKTGTRTITKALRMLGYDILTITKAIDPIIESLAAGDDGAFIEAMGEADGANAPRFESHLARIWKAYPTARCIMTTRPRESMISSSLVHVLWNRECNNGGVWDDIQTKGQRRHYDRHHGVVRKFFADKPGLLLEIDFTDGDAWPELCSFLETAVPDKRFPHVNRGVDKLLELLHVYNERKQDTVNDALSARSDPI